MLVADVNCSQATPEEWTTTACCFVGLVSCLQSTLPVDHVPASGLLIMLALLLATLCLRTFTPHQTPLILDFPRRWTISDWLYVC